MKATFSTLMSFSMSLELTVIKKTCSIGSGVHYIQGGVVGHRRADRGCSCGTEPLCWVRSAHRQPRTKRVPTQQRNFPANDLSTSWLGERIYRSSYWFGRYFVASDDTRNLKYELQQMLTAVQKIPCSKIRTSTVPSSEPKRPTSP